MTSGRPAGARVTCGTGSLRAGEAVEGLAGAAFRGLGAAGAHPRGGQVFPRLGEPLFEVADLRLELVFRRAGLGGGCRGRSNRTFGILEGLAALSGTLCCFLSQPLLLRPRAARLLLLRRLARNGTP